MKTIYTVIVIYLQDHTIEPIISTDAETAHSVCGKLIDLFDNEDILIDVIESPLSINGDAVAL